MAEAKYSLAGKRVFVAGHNGMVGAAIVCRLARENCTVLTASRAELDRRDQAAVDRWMTDNRPKLVFLAAGRGSTGRQSRILIGKITDHA